MKYAIISDVHGNLDALLAVLKDAEKFNIDKFIFVGDYCSSFGYPNEVIDTIRNIKDAIVVRGNEEDYIAEYANQDQSKWIDGQFQALYWLYKNLTESSHKYLRELPATTNFQDGDIFVKVTHKSSDIYGDVEYREFTSDKVGEKYQKNFTTRDIILRDIQEYMRSDKDFNSAIETLTDGVYIFGHSHVQWYAQYKDKVFINPGSCGLPLDGTFDAPYTLLEIENKQVTVTERRVRYDIDKLASNLRNSDLYKAAPVWTGIILDEIDFKFELAGPFLKFVEDYASKIGDNVRPYTVSTWTEAFKAWRMER